MNKKALIKTLLTGAAIILPFGLVVAGGYYGYKYYKEDKEGKDKEGKEKEEEEDKEEDKKEPKI